MTSPREFPPSHSLYVPPTWMKSPSARFKPVERNFFSDLDDDADSQPEDQEPAQDDADGDIPAENLP